MQKIITYLLAVLVFSIFTGCANKPQDRVTETNPGSVMVDSSDYNEIEAKNLANIQCAKSKRLAKKIDDPSKNSKQYYYFKCVF